MSAAAAAAADAVAAVSLRPRIYNNIVLFIYTSLCTRARDVYTGRGERPTRGGGTDRSKTKIKKKN